MVDVGSHTYTFLAKAARVVDGDTVDFLFDLGFGFSFKGRVRLANVNTPEIFGVPRVSEEYRRGMEAKDFVDRLLFDDHGKAREVVVRTRKGKTGKYGRWLADVMLGDGQTLGEQLIEAGLGTAVE